MKKIISFSFLSIFTFFLTSCEKEVKTQTQNIGQKVLALTDAATVADATVFLEFAEYFDSSSATPSSASFVAFAKNIKATDFFENVTINNTIKIDKTSDERFLSYPKLGNNNLFGKNATVEIAFKEIGDITTQLPIPKRLNVKSSIHNDDIFYKSQDLNLKWDVAGEQEKVYLAICADGVPCIIKELVDSGSTVVDKSEFLDFIVGKKVSVRLFRGIEQCMEKDGKTICIDAVIHSRSLTADIME